MILYKIKAYSRWHFGHTQQAGLIQIKNKSSTVKKDKTIWLLICNVLADQSCFESIQAGLVNGDLRKHNSGGEEAILEDGGAELVFGWGVAYAHSWTLHWLGEDLVLYQQGCFGVVAPFWDQLAYWWCCLLGCSHVLQILQLEVGPFLVGWSDTQSEWTRQMRRIRWSVKHMSCKC